MKRADEIESEPKSQKSYRLKRGDRHKSKGTQSSGEEPQKHSGEKGNDAPIFRGTKWYVYGRGQKVAK